jgi:hypothetical protein
MAFQLADRVRESNVISGTGNVSLGGAMAGFLTFASVMNNGDTTWYALVDNIANTWEVGIGTWNTGNTLSRTTVTASSNSNNLVSFGGNVCDCFMDVPAVKLQVLAGTGAFGTGADGTLTISSGTTTITRDMHYNNLTINGTGSLATNGFRVYVNNVLDISAAPANAIVATPLASTTIPGTSPVAAGGTPTTTTGGAGGNGSSTWFALAGSGATGGVGGAGTSAAGAAGGVTVAGQYVKWPGLATPPLQLTGNTNGLLQVNINTGSSGGGAGGGDGTNQGGSGGTAGTAGGGVIVAAFRVYRTGSTATAAISAKSTVVGGNGTASVSGNTGGGGGGGGGTGGLIWLLIGALSGSTATNCCDVSGTAGGAGGNGLGSGKGGTGGTGGASGCVQIINIAASTFTSSTQGAAGSAATTASTTTGTAGGAAATLQVSL